MSVNIGVIKSAIDSAVNSAAFRAANREAISGVTREKAEEALDRLVGCINDAISVSGAAAAAIGSASGSGVTPTGDGTHFTGSVDIPQNYRPSLDPGRYGGVDDMAALFNHGYDAGGTVIGEWHGIIIESLPHRPALHFVQSGVDAFNSAYGGIYNAHAEVDGRFS